MRVHLLIDTISINVEKRLEGHTRAMTSAAGGVSKFREREGGLSVPILYAFRREGNFQPIY